MDDMYHFLPQYLLDYYQQHCRGKEDMLIQLGVSFQRSMFCVTSAVIQALRTALLYPLDDLTPNIYRQIVNFLRHKWTDLNAQKHD